MEMFTESIPCPDHMSEITNLKNYFNYHQFLDINLENLRD